MLRIDLGSGTLFGMGLDISKDLLCCVPRLTVLSDGFLGLVGFEFLIKDQKHEVILTRK